MPRSSFPPDPPDRPLGSQENRLGGSATVGVATVLAVVAVAAFAIFQIPSNENQSANIVSIATAAFGVLGALAGAYFAVRSADKGITEVAAQREREDRGQLPPPAQL